MEDQKKEYTVSDKNKDKYIYIFVIGVICLLAFSLIIKKESIFVVFILLIVVYEKYKLLLKYENVVILTDNSISEKTEKETTTIEFENLKSIEIVKPNRIYLVDHQDQRLFITSIYGIERDDFNELKDSIFMKVRNLDIEIMGDKKHYQDYLFEMDIKIDPKNRYKSRRFYK